MDSPLTAALVSLAIAATAPAQALSGIYSVGPGGSYANIAAAVAALTANGVAGPVTFGVTANDVGPWTIGPFAGQGAANPVTFDGQGNVTLAGAEPVLTLNGCASVAIRGFRGTYGSTASAFVVNAGTTACVFAACDFRAPPVDAGAGFALFALQGGSACRIEDSTFGGGLEALYCGVNNDSTTVQRCRILGGGWTIMTIGGTNFTLVNNFVTGQSRYGINAGLPGNTASGTNLKIWHNAVYIDHQTSGGTLCSLRWYAVAAGTEVVDNIFYDAYPTVSSNAHNLWCNQTARPATMNFNCFWSNMVNYVPVWAGWYLTLPQWQALGFDLNSFQADPQFAAPTADVPDLSLRLGSPCATVGTTLPSVPTDFYLAARTPPVSIGAHEEDGVPIATYALFGDGCAGGAGVPSHRPSAAPRLGQTSVITFGNLPAPNLVVMVFGLSNTVATFGRLPFNLAPFGAPACIGWVSVDSTVFLAGSAGSVSMNLTIPNRSPLFGLQFFTQGLVLDPPRNALGAVTSGAAIAIIGL